MQVIVIATHQCGAGAAETGRADGRLGRCISAAFDVKTLYVPAYVHHGIASAVNTVWSCVQDGFSPSSVHRQMIASRST
eukprot:35835-Amphidinium_carterae.1